MPQPEMIKDENEMHLMLPFILSLQRLWAGHQLKKPNVMDQDVYLPPVLKIDDYELEAVHMFTYLVSNISGDLSLDAEINRYIGKATLTLADLTTCVWENNKLTAQIKIAVYNA